MNGDYSQVPAQPVEPVFPLTEAERQVLGLLPEHGDIPLSQAHLVAELAKQSRSNILGGMAVAEGAQPGDFYRLYKLDFRDRNGAAMTTAIMQRANLYASPEDAAALQAEASQMAGQPYLQQ